MCICIYITYHAITTAYGVSDGPSKGGFLNNRLCISSR